MAGFELVTDHIYRMEVPFEVFGGIVVPVAFWLVVRDGEWTLIDSGPPGAADELVAAVRLATRGAGVRRVLLTHGHYDHAGGLAALRRAWNPAVVCHRDEVPFVTGAVSYRRQRPRGVAFWFGRFFMRTGRWQIPVARELEGGQASDGLAVIHLPGHTPGQVGFLHPQDGALICGDAAMNLRDRLSPPFAFASPDPGIALASMVRMSELDYDHLLPSHGPPVLGGGRDALLDDLDRRGIAVEPI
ncbi:MAG TPA: MBL fold metallo-hydrolase [Anaerolineales bacterium]|nr:MBL fold metallo-hydrolase [Anaerolineales bacterium]